MNKLSEKTINMYNASLKRLSEHNINYDDIDNMQSIIKKIEELITSKNDYISGSTVNLYLKAILWYHKQSGNKDKNLALISKKISEVNDNQTNNYDKNELNEREKSVYIGWETVEKVCDELKEKRNKSTTQFKKFITIALYVYFPPRRLEDYSKMHIVENIKDACDMKYNYYITLSRIFIFNKYKNAKSDGIQKFKVPDNLADVLDEYINNNNLVGKELLGNNERDLCDKIKRILFTTTGKKATVNTLRHSYISYMQQNGFLKTTRERKILAEKMGHSHHIQQDIYVKNI